MCKKDTQIKFKISALKSSLCDYSDAYILLKGTITAAAAANNVDEKIIFKILSAFTNCISRINNKQVDDAHKTDLAMSTYTFI